jgi:hypothetical protein
LDRLTQAQTASCDSSFELYADWAEGMGAAQLCSLLGRPVGWLAGATATIAQAVDPQGGGRVRSFRVPLGQGAGGALCFWLDVVRRAAGWQAHVPSFFWSHDETGGEALVFVGAPGDLALATLWGAAAARTDICDLTVPGDTLGAGALTPSTHALSEGAADGNLWPVLEGVDALVKMRSL